MGGCGVSARKQPQAQDWWKEISIPWRAEAMMWGSPLMAWLPLLGSCHLPSPSLLEGTSTDTTLHCQGLRDLPESSSHWTSGKVCWQLCPSQLPTSHHPHPLPPINPLLLWSLNPRPWPVTCPLSPSVCLSSPCWPTVLARGLCSASVPFLPPPFPQSPCHPTTTCSTPSSI